MSFVRKAEVGVESRQRWNALPSSQREKLLSVSCVEKIVGTTIFFREGTYLDEIQREFERTLTRIVGSAPSLRYFHHSEEPEVLLARALATPSDFERISFGSDVAEDDNQLMQYFLSTPAYRRAASGEKAIFIGPKGSGKSAILRALQASPTAGYSIVITPEIFATSVLAQFEMDDIQQADDERAFIATWIFTILFEVFRRVNANPRGISGRLLAPIRDFVREYSAYEDMNIFTRWITYLKRIQSIKLGQYELAIKSRQLQELYNLERLYSLVPHLRKALKEDILILIDELDQGWDNSVRINKFVASLLHAATKIKQMDLRVHVVVLIRSEIFDLVKFELDQIDKLRSSIETIRWTDAELATLLLKRVGFSCGLAPAVLAKLDIGAIGRIFGEPCGGLSGFGYLVSRTSRRPREVLQLARLAHAKACEGGRAIVTTAALEKAEEDFSTWKFEHMCSEYKYIYPMLSDLLWGFRGQSAVLGRMEAEAIIDESKTGADGQVPAWLAGSANTIVQRLYDIDFLGAQKPGASQGSGVMARYEFAYERPTANVKRCESFMIHPALWRRLEIDRIGP